MQTQLIITASSTRFLSKVLMVLLLSIANISFGQSTKIKVVDENNARIVAASVTVYSGDVVSGAPQYYYTNAEGQAEFVISVKSTVIVSYVGYASSVNHINPGDSLIIRLTKQVNALQQVVITGQFDITNLNSTVESIKVLDEKLLKQTSSNTLRDILAFQPNIRISEDNILGSNTTINGLGGQNIKLLIDGVPVAGRENGNIDFGQMQLNNIERIEITEGPMSVLYSSDASAGVINLITKKRSQESFSLQGNVMAETPRSLYSDFWMGKNFSKSHIALSAGRNYFDGFPNYNQSRVQQWNPYIKYFGTLNYGLKANRYSNEFRFSYFNQLTLNRGLPVITPYDAYAFDQYFNVARVNVALHQDYKTGEASRLNWQSSYNYYSRTRETMRTDLTTLEQLNLSGADTRDSSIVQQWFSRLLLINNNKSNYRWQAGSEFNYEWAVGKRFRNNQEYIYEAAILTQMEIKPFQALQIKPGLRLNYNSRYKAPFIPALNIKYQLNENISLRGALSRGYRTPSLKELSLLFVDANHNIYGNENLQAEDSRYASLRADLLRTYYNVDITLSPSIYFTHIKNQIILAITDTASLKYQYVNLESVNSRGGNMAVTFRTDNVQVSFNYGINQLQTMVHKQTQTIWTPEFTAQLRWTMPKPNMHITVLMKNVGTTPVYYTGGNDITGRSTVDGYTLADVVCNKNLFKERIQFSIGVKNIFNVTNLNATNSGVHSGGNIVIARGRYYMSSIQWNIHTDRKKK